MVMSVQFNAGGVVGRSGGGGGGHLSVGRSGGGGRAAYRSSHSILCIDCMHTCVCEDWAAALCQAHAV